MPVFVDDLRTPKTKELNRTPDMILEYIKSFKCGYEIIKIDTPVVPYYDYDFSYDTEAEQKYKFDSDYNNSYGEVKNRYKTGKIIKFVSSGFDCITKNYKNSFHYVVRNYGFYKSNKLIPILPNCDTSVYSKYQKFRLPFCSKKKQGRFKNLYHNKKIYDINNFVDTGIEFDELLITAIKDEVEININDTDNDDKVEININDNDNDDKVEININDNDNDNIVEININDTDNDNDNIVEININDYDNDIEEWLNGGCGESDTDTNDDTDDIEIRVNRNNNVIEPSLENPFNTVIDFKNLLNLVSFDVINEYAKWIKFMRICKNIYLSFNEKDKIRSRVIIHNTMSQSEKYNITEVDKFLDATDAEFDKKTSWGSLIVLVKNKNLDGYNKLVDDRNNKQVKRKPKPVKKIKDSDIFNIERIKKLQSEPKKYYFGDYIELNGLKFKKPDTVIKYLVDTSFKISNGGNCYYITSCRTIKDMNDTDIRFEYIQKAMTNNPFSGIKKSIYFTISKIEYELYEFTKIYFSKFHYTSADMMPFSGISDPYRISQNMGNERILNKFEAFDNAVYIKTKDESFEKMLYHIKYIVCNGDESCYNYMMNWIAFKLQKPNKKLEVGILLHGLEGCGKNIFVEIIKELIGEKYIFQTGNIEDLTKGFNSHLSGKLLIIADEVIAYAGYKISDMLKNLITCPTLTITKKGMDGVKEKSFHSMICTTNNENSLRITENERRFFILSVDPAKKGKYSYFKDLINEINNRNSIKCLFDFITARDISNFDFRQIPITELKKDMIVAQLDEVFDFFVEYMRDKYFNDIFYIPCAVFYDDYIAYSNSKIKKKDLKNKVKQLFKVATKRKEGGENYVFNLIETNTFLKKLLNLTYEPIIRISSNKSEYVKPAKKIKRKDIKEMISDSDDE